MMSASPLQELAETLPLIATIRQEDGSLVYVPTVFLQRREEYVVHATPLRQSCAQDGGAGGKTLDRSHAGPTTNAERMLAFLERCGEH
jgi:hypothetical protein